MLTEAEWRKRAGRPRRTGSDRWGALCYHPHARRRRVLQKRSLQSVLLLIAGATGLLLPLIIPCAPAETFAEQPSALPEQRLVVRSVREVTYTLPKLETTRRIFTRAELLRGRMMLLDETHPLPEDAPAPNTASIARTANGSVPVRSLDVKTGRQTIAALAELFAQLRAVKADGIFVSGGAVTPVQQRQAYVDAMRGNMRDYPPDAAAAITAQTMEMPGSGERLQEYAVELAMMQPADGNAPPEDTPAGQLLLRYAWRYGFVRTSRQQPWRFRYGESACRGDDLSGS